MVTVSELIIALQQIQKTFPTARVYAEGWNDQGDLSKVELRGDVRLERDAVGNPIINLR